MKNCNVSKYLFLSGLLFMAGWGKVFAQSWTNMGGGLNSEVRVLFADTMTHSVYVGGSFDKAGQFNPDTSGTWLNGIAQWKNEQWNPLGCGVDRDSCHHPPWVNWFPNNVLAITRFQNELYVGGSFGYAGGIPAQGIAKWDGANWTNIGDVIADNGFGGTTPGGVYGFLTSVNELYALGVFAKIGNVRAHKIAKYDGINWTALPDLDTSAGGFSIASAAFYKGELYVAGNFDGGPGLKDIAKFDGTSWQSVGGGYTGFNTTINKLYVWNDLLYVGGYFNKAGGDPGNYIAAWDSIQWSDVGNGCQSSNVSDMIDFKGYLYVCGQIDHAGGVPVMYTARWDGYQWCDPEIDLDNAAGSMAVLNDSLFIGGGFMTINGDTMNNIAYYTGNSLAGACGAVNAIKEQKNEDSFSVFPNPANENIYINCSGTANGLRVCDILGKEVKYQAINAGKTEIDLSPVANGIYFILLMKDGASVSTKKILVQH